MFGQVLAAHLERVAALYEGITPGALVTGQAARPDEERELLTEMSEGRDKLRAAVANLGWPRPLTVSTGMPKGSWAHVYYVSLHDSTSSAGPTKGFYPVFLFSVDRRVCWLSVCLAAATVGVSGRGGWSQRRGEMLKSRATQLRHPLGDVPGWAPGPIGLGEDNAYLHHREGADRSSARAYECGAIIARHFRPSEFNIDLCSLTVEALRLTQKVRDAESPYLKALLPEVSAPEQVAQDNAAILGKRAEEYFLEWCRAERPGWGDASDRTDKVGLGFDVEFPDVGLVVEVKGFRGQIDSVRMTRQEWQVAGDKGRDYVLALVWDLEAGTKPRVDLLFNPHEALATEAQERRQIQVTFSLPATAVREAVRHSQP